MKIDASLIELGDLIDGHRVTGWYIDAKGAVMIEYNNRWHRHRGRIEVER